MTASPDRDRLERDLLELFRCHTPPRRALLAPWPEHALAPERFEALARDVLHHQLAHNAAYRRYAARMGCDPDAPLRSPFDAPPVPTDAFKRATLTTFDPDRAVATFRSSGTTEHERGRHHFATLEPTRVAARAAFATWMAPDDASLRMLVLMPRAERQPDSSLAFMLDCVARDFGDGHGEHYVDPARGLEVEPLRAALDRAIEEDVPVMLLGPSFAWVHLLDALPRLRLRLPRHSRLFETGGFKGKSRVVPRAELHAALIAALGLEPACIAGEYGMSELSSQLYEPCLRHHLAGHRGAPLRLYVPPPWCAVRVVDPVTLAPVPIGELGQIALLDLANLDSVAHVLTGDLGRMVGLDALPTGLPAPPPGLFEPALPAGVLGLELLGRAADAAPKGCSMALDAMLGG